MDDDDWYSPTFLETMVSALRNSQRVICRPYILFASPFLFFDVARWEIRRSRRHSFPGATLMFARDDWKMRPFRALSQDEDVWFYRDQCSHGAVAVPVDRPEIFLAVRHAGSQEDRSHTWTVHKDGRALEQRLLERPLDRRPEDLLPDWALEQYRELRQELLGPNGRLAPTFRYIRTGVPAAPFYAPSSPNFEYRPSGRVHAGVGEILGGERPRVLLVQNIRDGQGDEIIRTVPLMQALTDFNPRLQIVLLTRRAYLYAQPRITALPLAEPAGTHFDAVIDFFEPKVRECNHQPDLEPKIQQHIRDHSPRMVIAAAKGFNHFTYGQVELDGHDYACELRLDVQRFKNVYETTFRLIAELGLPQRTGEQQPASEWVLAGVPWPAADTEWQRLTQANTEGRPVALLNPFGGIEPLKGYTASQSDALGAQIRRWIGAGFFVIVAPNGTPWGGEHQVRAAIDRLSPADQAQTAIAPDAAKAPDADAATRQLIYFLRYADLIVAVEGWMIHAAYCLGKPYRTLMMPYSHPPEWQPYAQSPNQRIDEAMPPLHFDEQGEFIVEQPRKFALMELLEELGNAPEPEALPFLSRALHSLDRDIRAAAARALAQRSEPVARPLLMNALADPYYRVRAAAAAAFHNTPNGAAPKEEIEAHVAIGKLVRRWSTILQLGHKARPALEIAARDEDPVVRREAARAIERLDAARRGVVP
jgi:hypothetical protein